MNSLGAKIEDTCFWGYFEEIFLKSSFEQVPDELWASKCNCGSQTVPKYNIIYVFEETEK